MSREINMTPILMVCLGNICRSPLAEGILQSKLSETEFKVDSAGTAGYHIGEPPDHRSVTIAKKYGLDISNQIGRQFQVEDFDEFAHIFTMDASNFKNIVKLARNPKDISKVSLILDATNSYQSKDIPDPYYGGDEDFETVFQLLNVACEALALQLTAKC